MNINLTDDEKEVINFVAEGRSNKFITEKLCRSMSAIRSRIKSIYFKLNIDGNQYNKRLKLALLGQKRIEEMILKGGL
ncbi:response regulator transcription factor [bacterium]|nr:response regulator transcription factor [bacterium]